MPLYAPPPYWGEAALPIITLPVKNISKTIKSRRVNFFIIVNITLKEVYVILEPRTEYILSLIALKDAEAPS